MSYILRGSSADSSIRIFVADTTSMVEKARTFHHTTPVASAALGRTLTAASIMGLMMKGENDKLTLSIKGDGPLGGIVCVSDSKGIVKGYVHNPLTDLPLRDDKKLDVGGAVGKTGLLTVIRDMGMKQPYTGQYQLVSGEIAEDITAYFAYSEQQPSAVSLGVLVDTDYSIKAAGGFIVQLLPHTSAESLDILEKNLRNIPSITAMLSDNMDAEQIMELVLEDLEPQISEKISVEYKCDCSKERLEKALASIGKKELISIIEEDEKAELTCHFCNTVYDFSKEDLTDILNSLD